MFETREELVRYLRSRAAEHKTRACAASPRSHKNSEHAASAATYESIAAMIERSNVGVTSGN